MTKDVEKNVASVKPAVDWTRPIEAVHEDGRVVLVSLTKTDASDTNMTRRIGDQIGDGVTFWFRENGTHHKGNWHIRNVAQPTTRTAAEQLDRMEALVRRMAARNLISEVAVMNTEDFQEARAIVADLPAVVDPDIQIARDIVADAYEAGDILDAMHRAEWANWCRRGAYDKNLDVRSALAAIKRGRALASEGK